MLSIFGPSQNRDIIRSLEKKNNILVSGISNFAAKTFVVSEIIKSQKELKSVLWVVNSKQEQETVCKMLEFWGNTDVKGFNIEEGDILGPAAKRDNYLQVIALLSSLREAKKEIVVLPYLNLLHPVPGVHHMDRGIFTIDKGFKGEVSDLFEELISRGYELAKNNFLRKGTYFKQGGVLHLYPVNMDNPVKIDLDFDKIGDIIEYQIQEQKDVKKIEKLKVYPIKLEFDTAEFYSYLGANTLLVEDELEVTDDIYEQWSEVEEYKPKNNKSIEFVPFAEDSSNHLHSHYISMLKYQNPFDLVNDLQEKRMLGFKPIILTKHKEELLRLLEDKKVPVTTDSDALEEREVRLMDVDHDKMLPAALQNPNLKICLFSDKEMQFLQQKKRAAMSQRLFLDLLTSLKVNDYVVHVDHGIAKFLGLEKKEVDDATKEYLKLGYAENDKLFVPIDQADKVNKYIGDEGHMPRLTRLGSAEWATITGKVKRETQEIAKELLKLYAKRGVASGFGFGSDTIEQEKMEKLFPYEETPGQMQAIFDVKKDMESKEPMDRLICGDVGFGKTEVAMRAAFKAVQDNKQVAIIAPITILADQHYKSFRKRMDDFGVRIDMLSRFKTPKQQKEVIEKLKKGEIDIVIGTHRLLQADIEFKNLGILIIDEEQRFGVKQKEELKKLRASVDILTLTATPIPRTLNISLNKLKDITIINTPPPGRLPVITEVRKFSLPLIREAILKELERAGQVYMLHNRVQTIDGFADKLRSLIPEARFVVAHGKLGSGDLEERIMAFKEHKYDVLVSSTIIENGIDLSNANTLVVNGAEKFGLAQLYQLRGRVGRGKNQAYAYFLYHGQRLKLDAKRRLRAIVEASELGSGFDIAMKDLEIRGAGDILGANQHGVINVVGVSHFIRMLNKTIDEMKAGKASKDENGVPEVSIELPLTAFIPDEYIINSKDKIQAYQRLSSADTHEYLNEIKDSLAEEYGEPPKEAQNLFRIISLKIYAKMAHLVTIKAENIHNRRGKRVVLHLSNKVTPANIVNLLDYNADWTISGNKMIIDTEKLGVDWFVELETCVRRLGKKRKHGSK